jgi:pimeloyl-ACP methyl ester carboxylesterase
LDDVRDGRAEVGGVPVSTTPGPQIDRPTPEPKSVDVPGVTQAPGSGMDGYLRQKPEWRPCGIADSPELECATLKAPVDYLDPDAAALTLALARRPAARTPAEGMVFFNPGGPGASGVQYLSRFAPKALERFDVVTWDPRGVGESTPVRCDIADEEGTFAAIDQLPATPTDWNASVAANWSLGQACWEDNGDYLAHVGTASTVQDLDLLRVVMGQERLNYLGVSYGTKIGQWYALTHPDTVGRMVLDGAVSPTLDADSELEQITAFGQSLERFAQWCQAGRCGERTSAAQVLDWLVSLILKLDAQPLRVDDERLTGAEAFEAVLTALYAGVSGWQALARGALDAESGNGTALLRLSQSGFGTDPETGGQELTALVAVNCADSPDSGVVDAYQRWVAAAQASPMMGRFLGPDLVCALWPVPPTTGPDPSAPRPQVSILVLGNVGDNATPYQNAVAMAESFPRGSLLTFEGEGHGSFHRGSSCVDEAVAEYLTTGAVPQPGTRCQ